MAFFRAEVFLICLLCCNVDFSELSLHSNSIDVNRVLFYRTQKKCNLRSFSELGSYLICLYTTGPKRVNYPIQSMKLILCLTGSDGSMSASGSVGPGFYPRQGSKFSFENFQSRG